MPLKMISELGDAAPTRLGWAPVTPDVLAANLRFGAILHVGVCDEGQRFLFDQPVWAEPIGALVVPVTTDGCIVLLENFRPVALPPATGTYPPKDLVGCGVVSLELPRGFPELGETPPEAALREAEEELGFLASNAETIGYSNPNTTYFMHSLPVCVVEVDPKTDATRPPDSMERIGRVRVMAITEVLAEIAANRIFCGMTKSALLTFLASDRGRRLLVQAAGN